MIAPVGRSVHRMMDGLCFSSASLPYVNQHSTTLNLFWLLTFDLLSPLLIFFSTPTSILPYHLDTLLTYILALPTT
jgi:hypothetical protein